MEKKISAPFSPDQVQVLNERQCHVDGGVAIHPFTCPNRNEGVTYDRIRSVADDALATHGLEGGDRGLLIATPGGWVCPHCTYTQSWAYASMAIRPTPVAELCKRPFLHVLDAIGAVREAMSLHYCGCKYGKANTTRPGLLGRSSKAVA